MTNTDFSLQRSRRMPQRAALLAFLGAAAFVSACTEPDVILPGEREDIRSVLQDQTASLETASTFEGNQSRTIGLPAARVNADWSQTAGSPSARVTHPALGSNLTLAWSANIGSGDSRKYRITADPVVAGGRIFTLDAQSVVTATSTSGATLWQVDVRPARDQEGDATGGGLVVSGDTVYVSAGVGVLAALDVSNGGVRWTQQLDASGSGTPSVAGDLVYVTAGDNAGWAINRGDGTVAWQIGASEDTNNILGAPAPAITDDLAIFAFGSGEVQAVFRRGGLNRWDASVLGKRPGRALSNISDVTAAPVVSGDRVYLGNQSGRIVALDTASGARIWSAPEGATSAVWPIAGSIFAVSDLNELLRLDAADGSRIWGTPLPNFLKSKPKRQVAIVPHHGPIVAGGRVIIASGDGLLRSFDPTNGALVGSSEIPGGATTAPVVAGRTLYVVSAKGQLLAYR
ncbi:PQQ-like beta-propeller repeat protein [Sulfitobacter sp. S223]|uniref:PQQ-like beta-propeller repeat protein n=1 Tax=Sulfitobacter sp. S223 TaxID=2867023 RepID=UPI0021A36CDF|nr:PQQ-like beta-propeller repeat protein [Sulfitobacter sp. S223]UWR25142.1 PQQ-like beta-propeller repeat protein [Sulfitobacter sp. S223]